MRTVAITLGLAFIPLAGSAYAEDGSVSRPISTELLQLVSTEKPVYPLGACVELSYVIQNQTRKPLTYRFSSSKQFDIWVTRGGKEVFRASRGRMYAQALTSFTLKPRERKTFTAKWDQKDFDCKQVGPGTYEVSARLTNSGYPPPAVVSQLQIGGAGISVLPVTVRQAISMFNDIRTLTVSISGVYRGWKPDPNDSNTKSGPPVTRSDWAIRDSTGCMYVNGSAKLDPDKDLDKKITITGKLQRTSKGQVYLILKNATVGK